MTITYLVVISSGRLCENTVHGSTRLTTNGVVSLEISTYPFAPSIVKGLRESFHIAWRSEESFSMLQTHGPLKMNHYPKISLMAFFDVAQVRLTPQ